MEPEPLPLNLLVGPLSPNLDTERQYICNPLSSMHCLGDYFGHPQIQSFFIETRALSHLVPAGEQIQRIVPAERLELAVEPAYLLQPLLDSLAPHFKPDLLLWWGLQYGLPQDFKQITLPKVLVASDWHLYHSCLTEIFDAFDYLLCDQKLLQILSAQGHRNAEYWPAYAFDASMIPPEAAPRDRPERDIDLLFVGNHSPHKYQQRNHYLARLAALPYRTLIRSDLKHSEYLRYLQRSKIAFNFSLRQEMNMRAYEAAACGALLFIEADNLEVQQFLTPGQDCVLYTSENLEALIAYYLEHDHERRTLAQRANRRIAMHTYTHQFSRLVTRLADIHSQITQAHASAPSIQAESLSAAASLNWQIQRTALALSMDTPSLRLAEIRQLESYLQADFASEQRIWILNALLVCQSDLAISPPTGFLPAFAYPLPELRAALKALPELSSQPIVIYNLAWSTFLSPDPSGTPGSELKHWLKGWQDRPTSLACLAAPLSLFVLPLRYMGFYEHYQTALAQDQQAPQAQAGKALQRYLEMAMLYLQAQVAEQEQDSPAALNCFQAAEALMPMAELSFAQSRLYLLQGQKAAAFEALCQGLNQGVYFKGAWWALLILAEELLPADALQGLLKQAFTLFQDQAYRDFRAELKQRFSSLLNPGKP